MRNLRGSGLVRRVGHAAAALSVVWLAGSCSLVDAVQITGIPSCSVAFDDDDDDTVQKVRVTARDGYQCAQELRASYLDGINANSRLRTLSGIGLVGLLTTTGVLAVRDVIDTNDIASGVIAGAGVYTAANFVLGERRPFVMLAGAEAISCVLASAEPAIDYPGAAALQQQLTRLSGSITAFRVDAAALDNSTIIGQRVGRTLTRAIDVRNRGQAALTALDELGMRIMAAMRTVDGAVSAALLAEQTDLSTLVENFGSAIALVQNQLGAAGLGAPGLLAEERPSADPSVDASLPNRLFQFEQLIEDVEVAVERLELKLDPTRDGALNAKCQLQANTLRVVPPRVEARTDRSTAATLEFVVSGGTGPYLVNILPVSVSGGLSLQGELTYDAGGSGIYRVAVPQTAGSSQFVLLVRDGRGREARADILVNPADAQATGGGATRTRSLGLGGTGTTGTGGGGGGPVSDPQVLTAQGLLRDLWLCFPGMNDDLRPRDSVIDGLDPGALDGRLGQDTRDAIEVFRAGFAPGVASTDLPALVASMRAKLTECRANPAIEDPIDPTLLLSAETLWRAVNDDAARFDAATLAAFIRGGPPGATEQDMVIARQRHPGWETDRNDALSIINYLLFTPLTRIADADLARWGTLLGVE